MSKPSNGTELRTITATPANFIDRDTFRTFDCRDQSPTFLYTYKQAVDDKRLVDFRLYQAQTGFQRNGIKGVDLSEEDRNCLIEFIELGRSDIGGMTTA